MARKEEVKAFLPDHRKNRSKWMIVFRGRISPPLPFPRVYEFEAQCTFQGRIFRWADFLVKLSYRSLSRATFGKFGIILLYTRRSVV